MKPQRGDPDGATRDAAIEQASIDGAERPIGAIKIADYDPNWAIQFGAQAALIRTALGSAALSVDHIGSTSVPGLAAKPVLDIVLTVSDSSAEECYLPTLEALGYELKIREPDWFEHRMFKLAAPPTNLHVFSVGCPEIRRMLVFRDWLRSHPDDRLRYEDLKHRLASQQWRFIQNYADAKTEVVAEIMARASGLDPG